LIGCPDVELEREVAEIVAAAGHLQDPSQHHLEFRRVKRRPDQARVLEEQLVGGISAAATQGIPECAKPGFCGAGEAPAHVRVIEVGEPQEAQRQRRDPSARHSSDTRDELVGRVADRQQARDHGACADAKHHVEVVHPTIGEAIIEALENAHLVVDAGDASPRGADGGLADAAGAGEVDGAT
jgi:hypothetical protein